MGVVIVIKSFLMPLVSYVISDSSESVICGSAWW